MLITSLKKNIEPTKTSLVEIVTIKKEIQQFIKSMQFTSDKYEKPKHSSEQIETTLKEIKQEIADMKTEIHTGGMDREQRQKNVAISGLSKVKKSECQVNISKILQKINISKQILKRTYEISNTSANSSFLV